MIAYSCRSQRGRNKRSLSRISQGLLRQNRETDYRRNSSQDRSRRHSMVPKTSLRIRMSEYFPHAEIYATPHFTSLSVPLSRITLFPPALTDEVDRDDRQGDR